MIRGNRPDCAAGTTEGDRESSMFRKQIVRALTLATIVSLLMSSVVLADTVTVSNELLVNTNVTKAPGTTGTGYVRVVPSTGTPVGDTNGCNVRPSEPLTVNLSSSNAQVTLDSTSVSVTTCDVDYAFGYTVAASANGSATISISSVSGGRAEGTRLYQTTDTLFITISAPANTAPSVPGTPLLAAGSTTPNQGAFSLTWTASTDDGLPTGSTVTYTLQHKDADDAAFSNVATSIATNSYSFANSNAEAEGTWTYRVLATDGAASGSASAASSAIKVDRSGPSAPTASTNPMTAAFSTWFKDTVMVGYSGATDPALADGSAGSGVASYSDPQVFTTTGANAYSGYATDATGNAGSAVAGSVNVDSSNPTYDCGTLPTDWSGSDRTIDCTAADTGSGLKTAAMFSLTTNVAAGSDTTSASTDAKTVSDNVDHSVTASISGLKVDKKAPSIDCGAAKRVSPLRTGRAVGVPDPM